LGSSATRITIPFRSHSKGSEISLPPHLLISLWDSRNKYLHGNSWQE
jgi:hypothetical protein